MQRPLGFEEPPFPILIRLSDLQGHRTAHRGRPGAPAKSLYRTEWKEVVLLLAGVLLGQGAGKRVDNLVSAVLGQLGEKPSLPDQARCAGILGAIVRDLAPLKYQPSMHATRMFLNRLWQSSAKSVPGRLLSKSP